MLCITLLTRAHKLLTLCDRRSSKHLFGNQRGQAQLVTSAFPEFGTALEITKIILKLAKHKGKMIVILDIFNTSHTFTYNDLPLHSNHSQTLHCTHVSPQVIASEPIRGVIFLTVVAVVVT